MLVEVLGEAIGIERFAVLDSTDELPVEVFKVDGVHGSRYRRKCG